MRTWPAAAIRAAAELGCPVAVLDPSDANDAYLSNVIGTKYTGPRRISSRVAIRVELGFSVPGGVIEAGTTRSDLETMLAVDLRSCLHAGLMNQLRIDGYRPGRPG